MTSFVIEKSKQGKYLETKTEIPETLILGEINKDMECKFRCPCGHLQKFNGENLEKTQEIKCDFCKQEIYIDATFIKWVI